MRKCIKCGHIIPTLRIEALPFTKVCRGCSVVKPYVMHEDISKRSPHFKAEETDAVALRTDKDERTAYRTSDLEEIETDGTV
jgi:hypothetical protein